MLAAGVTPAAAAQKISGANVSYSPATAVAPQNMPKSTSLLNNSLFQVLDDIGNFSSMAQAQASADKTNAETKVISETSIKKANAEIEKILSDTLKSYSDIKVNESQIDLNSANTDLATEKVDTEQVNRRSIELSNDEKSIQLEFTRKTLEMSIQKTEAEIKVLSEQTAKLQEELNGLEFETKYKEWRNTYIETYGVAPEQGWEDTLFKAVIDGKARPMLDAFSESLRLVFSPDDNFNFDPHEYNERGYNKHGYNKKGQYNIDEDWFITKQEQRKIKRMKRWTPELFDSLGNVYYP